MTDGDLSCGAEAPNVEVILLHPDAVVPNYAMPGDAGADLVTTTSVVLGPGERAVLGTGLALALPTGYAGFVHPRSGLAAKVGLGMVNAPGTIDADYRGEIKVIVINHDRTHPIQLRAGDRIAQLIIQRVARAEFCVVGTLPDSVRGGGGLGSTGGADALGSTGGADALGCTVEYGSGHEHVDTSEYEPQDSETVSAEVISRQSGYAATGQAKPGAQQGEQS